MTLAGTIENIFALKSLSIVALLFIPLERLLPLRRTQKVLRKGWKNDLIYLVLNSALMNVAVAIGALVLLQLKSRFLPVEIASEIHQPVWLQVIELILIIDLLHYAVHRLYHTVPFLWRFHALHHSIEELDWLATVRVHPVDQAPTAIAMLLPILLLGWSPFAVVIWSVVYRWHAFLQHANIRLPLGRVGLVVVGPEFHRWHHSTSPAARDKNFAAQFALWDVIFGTCYLPSNIASDEYGIDEELPTAYVDQLCHPLRGLAQKSAS
jgi:sterol desaturase/sphingolipid hydroxylase (fatty acid hydroxylase superfamily)